MTEIPVRNFLASSQEWLSAQGATHVSYSQDQWHFDSLVLYLLINSRLRWVKIIRETICIMERRNFQNPEMLQTFCSQGIHNLRCEWVNKELESERQSGMAGHPDCSSVWWVLGERNQGYGSKKRGGLTRARCPWPGLGLDSKAQLRRPEGGKGAREHLEWKINKSKQIPCPPPHGDDRAIRERQQSARTFGEPGLGKGQIVFVRCAKARYWRLWGGMFFFLTIKIKHDYKKEFGNYRRI